MLQNNFYVYQLRRADQKYPFYIGKGKDRRAYEHLKKSSLKDGTHKSRTILKAQAENVDVLIEYVECGLSEREALDLEEVTIWLYGRSSNGTGILTNLTDGGEGLAGFSLSAESRKKLSASVKASMANVELRTRLREAKLGTVLSEEHKRKIGDAHRGKKLTVEQAENLRKSNVGRKRTEAQREAQRQRLLGRKPSVTERENLLKTIRRGEKAPNASFSAKKVRDIRSQYAQGEISLLSLAKMYGVTKQCIHNVVSRKTYKDVE